MKNFKKGDHLRGRSVLKNRAVIYVRVSTKKESQKDSPEHQEAVCRDKAEDEGLEVIDVYKDRESGETIIGRKEVLRMLKDANYGLFDVVIFASISRFSRDIADASIMKNNLVDALGVRLISIDEAYDSLKNPSDLIFNIHLSVAHERRGEISRSSRRGLEKSAEKGNFTGSRPPFGYKKVNVNKRKTLAIDHDTKHIVEMIYDMYVNQKMGDKAIVNFLNNENIPSPRGGKWGITTIQRILQNEAYIGVNVYSKYTVVRKRDKDITKPLLKTKKQVQVDKSLWKRTSFKTHDAIIDEEIFKQAQEIRLLRGGGKRGGVRNKVNVFAGFIKCAHCGAAMVSMRGKISKEGKAYRYLICSTQRRKGRTACENDIWIGYENLHNCIIGSISSKLRILLDSNKIAREGVKKLSVNKMDHKKEIDRLNKKIEENRKHILNIRREKIAGHIDDKQFQYEKETLENEISGYEFTINALKRQMQQQEDQKLLMMKLKSSVERLMNFEQGDFDSQHILLRTLLERIEVTKDEEVYITTYYDELVK